MSDTKAVGTVHSMGWEKDEETGEEVFYAHLRFTGVPLLSPKLVWEAVPVSIVPELENASSLPKRSY